MIPLEELEEGIYTVKLFYDDTVITKFPLVTIFLINSQTSQAAPNAPTSLTGAKSDQPLLIARERGKLSKAIAPLKASETDSSKALIRAIAASDILPQEKNTTARMGLDAFNTFQAFIKPFKPFSKKEGGYLIPHGKFYILI